MKYTLLLSSLLLIFSSCDFSNKMGNPKKAKSSVYKMDTIKFDIILDISLASNVQRYDTTHRIINHFLDELGFGYNVKFEVIRTPNLDSINTAGKINQDNIYESLGLLSEYDPDEEPKFRLVLFKNSEFFNTANAVCMGFGNDQFIFGDGNLLHSPMLFIHELGHALGLTHYNKRIFDDCYNIMHESAMGCSFHFSKRQAEMIRTGEYVYPQPTREPSPDKCLCNRNGLNTLEEEYLNSLDRNIDDTPIVGDYISSFSTIYKDELRTGKPHIDIVNELKRNFENEWERYLNGKNSIAKSAYVDDRLKTHSRMRANNLSRWLREIEMKTNFNFNQDENYFNRDTSFYSEKIDKLDVITCNAILDNLAHHYIKMKNYKEILDSIDGVKSCYLDRLDELYPEAPNDTEPRPGERNGQIDRGLRTFLLNFDEANFN